MNFLDHASQPHSENFRDDNRDSDKAISYNTLPIILLSNLKLI